MIVKRISKLTLIYIAFLSLVGLLVLPAQQATAYDEDPVIIGDEVKIDTSKGSIKVYPHTLAASGWVTVEFQSVYTGQVDVVLGFNGYDGAGISKTDINANIDLTWNSTLGASKWQSVEVNQDVKAGEWYKVKCWVDVPFSYTEEGETPKTSKYNVLIKPSKLTLADALKSGSYILLDPWYNASWPYRIAYTISRPPGAVTDYQWPIKIYYGSGTNGTESWYGLTIGKVYLEGDCQTDFDDIRVTSADGQTLQDICLIQKVDSSYAVFWVKHDSIGTTATTFYVYYGNDAAASVSSGTDTFIQFEDAEWGNDGDPLDDDGGSVDWTIDSGDCEIDTANDIGDETGFIGTRSALIKDDGVNNGQAYITQTAGNGYSFQFWMRAIDTAQVSFRHDDGTSMIHWAWDTLNDIWYNDGAEQDTGEDWIDDTWHLMEVKDIDWAGATYDLWFDGAEIVDDAGMRVISSAQDIFQWAQPLTNDYCNVDNIIVRKYSNPEPTFGSWGSEETSSPAVTTKASTGFGHTWAILNGEIDSEGEGGSVTQIGWDYGLTDAYGSSITESGSYTTGVNYSGYVDGLTAGTLYHFRFKAYNGSWGYGEDMVFATEGSPSLYEYLDTNNDGYSDDIYGANWVYQTFTVDTAHTIETLYLYVKRTGSPGDVVASIKRTSSGTPTGEDLGSVTYDGDTFSTSSSWYLFDFSSQGVVLEDDQYAIVVRAIDGDDSNDVQWACDLSGGLTEGEPGNAGHSTNSGASWASDAPEDNLFRLWGYPALDVADAKVFTGYREAGDWLIVARYTNLYPPYYDSYDVQRYFVLQLASGSDIYAETALPQWGNRVASIYINADDVESLEYEGSYRVRMYGIFTGNPYTEYELQPSDWLGDDLNNLDSWIITSAGEIGDYYNTDFTTYIAERGEVLNAEGGVLIANGIAGLSAVRPGLFQIYTLDSLIDEDDTYTQEGRHSFSQWQARIGESGTVAMTRLADMIGVEDGGAVLAGIFIILSFCICGFGFTPGHTVAANVLSFIPLIGAIVFGVDAIYIVVLVIIAAFLFVKAAFIDK